MLEYIWGFIFFLASVFCGYIFFCRTDDESFEDSVLWMFGGYASAGLSIVITWPKIGEPFFMLLLESLPQQGEMISMLTAFVLAALVGILYVISATVIGGFVIGKIMDLFSPTEVNLKP